MDDSNSDSDEDEDEDNVKAMSPDTHLQPGGLQGHGCLRQLTVLANGSIPMCLSDCSS